MPRATVAWRGRLRRDSMSGRAWRLNPSKIAVWAVRSSILSSARLLGRRPRNWPGFQALKIPYAPCLAGLFLYEGEWVGASTARYAISDRSGHALAWSACENHKPGRVGKGFTVMVVHASEEFSCTRLEDDPASWADDLRVLVEERWEIPSSAFRALHPHRWRYARISQKMEIPALPEGWHFAGDLLTESRVESAWLAGRKVAARILSGA